VRPGWAAEKRGYCYGSLGRRRATFDRPAGLAAKKISIKYAGIIERETQRLLLTIFRRNHENGSRIRYNSVPISATAADFITMPVTSISLLHSVSKQFLVSHPPFCASRGDQEWRAFQGPSIEIAVLRVARRVIWQLRLQVSYVPESIVFLQEQEYEPCAIASAFALRNAL